jgi:hypothetical protein
MTTNTVSPLRHSGGSQMLNALGVTWFAGLTILDALAD